MKKIIFTICMASFCFALQAQNTLSLELNHLFKGQAFALNQDYNDDQQRAVKKFLFVPQISYSDNGFTYFATADFPLYEDLNGSQFATQTQFTVGVSYRFLVKEPEVGGVLH